MRSATRPVTRIPRARERMSPLAATRFAAIGIFISAAFALAPVVQAQRATPTEYQVKAAYLYNFGKFVSWPDNGGGNDQERFEICVLGDDPFGSVLDAVVTGGKIRGKSTVTRRIANPADAGHCRILFISSSEDQRLTQILAVLEKTNVLTVSDMPQFAQRGGMIQFVQDGARIRFEVNLKNAEDAGLNLSSELLKVAVRVTGNPHPGN